MGNGKGFSGVNTLQDFVFADNASFDGTLRGGGLETNGQLWIGQTTADRPNDSGHVKVGTLTSPNNTIAIGYSSPNITLDLTGGGVGIDSIAVPNGTSPVVPTAAGLITYTEGTGFNITGGLNTIDFALDGGVVGQTITGDSGGALSPTAGNWNILGGPGVTTSGSGSTLTIQAVAFVNRAVNGTMTSDSGNYITAAGVTVTTPAGPGQGDELYIVATTADTVIVDAASTHTIRIGSLVSSAGGTATSTAIGDVLVLRYYAAGTQWIATSVIGTWVMA